MLSHGHQLNFQKNNKSTVAAGLAVKPLEEEKLHLVEKLASQIVKNFHRS